MPIVYDIETYPNVFLLNALDVTFNSRYSFEISDRRCNLDELIHFVRTVGASKTQMVGFNNLGFDYPVLNFIVRSGVRDPAAIYEYAMAILQSSDATRFKFMVRPTDWIAPQIDLFKIHHFDNKARMTSLKALEFNMRLPNVRDLPFPPGTVLGHRQIQVLTEYCWDDVEATALFFDETRDAIDFRNKMSELYKFDFTNCSDVKIGKQVFQLELEKAGVSCYDYHPDTGRIPRQTPRSSIQLGQCIPEHVEFDTPEFKRIEDTLRGTTITQTKGAFDNLTTTVKGLEFKFGTGGIHASVEKQSFVSSDTHMIYDIDVTSLYPSIAIENGYYPEHLGRTFVEVYRRLRERRVGYKKGTPENASLKLALNGVYGDSNSPFSVFYDPLFTMSITITGQMDMAMLCEQIMAIPAVEIIQVNTDGITMYLPREMKPSVDFICGVWENRTRLKLENVEYRRMFIADVNSYLAEDMNGKVKRKGRYEHDVQWHQDASALVVPKVAEQVLLHDVPIRETIENWPDIFDFMLRVKVPRNSRLTGHDSVTGAVCDLPNMLRYYVSKGGVELVKTMPPLPKSPDKLRHIGVQSGFTVNPCNDVLHSRYPINFDYYVQEVEKLVLGVL